MGRRVDDVLRFIYVLLAPAMMVALGYVVPIGGIVISTGIATAIALAGSDGYVRRVQGITLIGKPLAKLGRLGEYYREHPPKPLLYYVFYPLLFPYWLWKREARKELLAYKRVGALAVIITVVTGFYDYYRNWDPMPAKLFLKAAFANSVLGLLITMIFVMPIVTTLIGYQARRHLKSIAALIILGVTLGGTMSLAMRQVETVPFQTQARLKARIKWRPDPARAVMRAALDRAIGQRERPEALRVAREELATYFRPDEVRAFRLLGGEGVVMLVAKTKNHEYAWTAKTKSGWVTTAAELPAAARDALELSATASAWP